MLLFIFETIFNDANIAFKKTKIKYFTYIIITFIFAIKNITFHKFNLLTFIFTENITFKIIKTIKFFLLLISLLIYRAILFLSLVYKFYQKLYLIIVNLYMRYTLLNKTQFIIIRLKIIFFIIFI